MGYILGQSSRHRYRRAIGGLSLMGEALKQSFPRQINKRCAILTSFVSWVVRNHDLRDALQKEKEVGTWRISIDHSFLLGGHAHFARQRRLSQFSQKLKSRSRRRDMDNYARNPVIVYCHRGRWRDISTERGANSLEIGCSPFGS